MSVDLSNIGSWWNGLSSTDRATYLQALSGLAGGIAQQGQTQASQQFTGQQNAQQLLMSALQNRANTNQNVLGGAASGRQGIMQNQANAVQNALGSQLTRATGDYQFGQTMGQTRAQAGMNASGNSPTDFQRRAFNNAAFGELSAPGGTTLQRASGPSSLGSEFMGNVVRPNLSSGTLNMLSRGQLAAASQPYYENQATVSGGTSASPNLAAAYGADVPEASAVDQAVAQTGATARTRLAEQESTYQQRASQLEGQQLAQITQSAQQMLSQLDTDAQAALAQAGVDYQQLQSQVSQAASAAQSGDTHQVSTWRRVLGAVLPIAGIALAPFTGGASLALTIGLGAAGGAIAGGGVTGALTGAAAGALGGGALSSALGAGGSTAARTGVNSVANQIANIAARRG